MVLTRRQRQVIDFIAGFLQEQGYSPSFQEIAQGLGLSSLATVHKHVLTLERKGFLKRQFNASRSIEPSQKYLQEVRRARQDRAREDRARQDRAREDRALEDRASSELPLLGLIAAGKPVEALEQPETISLGDFVRQKNVFVLQVKGDSMIEEHILEGDFILVEKTAQVSDGDIVVALVGGSESTLKRLYREGSRVRLQPANARMKPIILPANDVTVQGRVLGVLRRY
jgi:repressor LexA